MMKILLMVLFILLVLIYDVLSIKLNITIVDEFIMLLLFLYAFLIYSKRKIKLLKEERYIFKFVIILLLIGILSSFIFKVQPIKYQLMDVLIFSKFFIVYYSMRIILLSKNYNYIISNQITTPLIFITTFIFILILFDKVSGLFPIFDFKYFNIGSEELFFGHPSRFAFAVEMILLLLFPLLKKSNGLVYVFTAILIIGVLSLRTKYFIFVFIFVAAIFILKVIKVKQLSTIKLSIISFFLLVFVLFFALHDIQNHILLRGDGGQGVRGLLLFAGYDIALNHFPLGTGFGSFGSYISTVNYSSLYYTYHFDNIPGCMPDRPSFLADNFFAMILGQFGFFGLLFFVLILAYFAKILILAYNNDYLNRYYYMSALLMIIIIFYESFSDSILSQNRGVFIAIYLAYIINKFDVSRKLI